MHSGFPGLIIIYSRFVQVRTKLFCESFVFFFCNAGVSSQAGLHQQDVYYEADYEGPYVVDGVDDVQKDPVLRSM